jgi:PI-3-kinase-related kinase SMG-1
LVGDVRHLVRELSRATVLWEELWLSTLQELAGDVARRVATLNDEARTAASRRHLSAPDRHRLAQERFAAVRSSTRASRCSGVRLPRPNGD